MSEYSQPVAAVEKVLAISTDYKEAEKDFLAQMRSHGEKHKYMYFRERPSVTIDRQLDTREALHCFSARVVCMDRPIPVSEWSFLRLEPAFNFCEGFR